MDTTFPECVGRHVWKGPAASHASYVSSSASALNVLDLAESSQVVQDDCIYNYTKASIGPALTDKVQSWEASLMEPPISIRNNEENARLALDVLIK